MNKSTIASAVGSAALILGDLLGSNDGETLKDYGDCAKVELKEQAEQRDLNLEIDGYSFSIPKTTD